MRDPIAITEMSELSEVHEFYEWSRDYWMDLSRSPDGTNSYVLNFGLWPPGTDNLYEAQQHLWDAAIGLLGEAGSHGRGLEVGCGIGGFAVKLARRNAVRLVCLDLLQEHLRLARIHAREENVQDRIELRQGSSMAIPLHDGAFDFVYCIESSFHYPDKRRFLEEIHRVVKRGGVFVLADITCENNALVTFRKGNYYPASAVFRQDILDAGFAIEHEVDIGERVFVPLKDYVKRFNHGRRTKLAKYWELVLSNYAKLSQQHAMGYQLYRLRKD